MPRRSIIIAVRGGAARVAIATAWIGRAPRGRDVEGTGTAFVLERGSDFRVPRLDVFEQFPGDQASGPCVLRKIFVTQPHGVLCRRHPAVCRGLYDVEVCCSLRRQAGAVAFCNWRLRCIFTRERAAGVWHPYRWVRSSFGWRFCGTDIGDPDRNRFSFSAKPGCAGFSEWAASRAARVSNAGNCFGRFRAAFHHGGRSRSVGWRSRRSNCRLRGWLNNSQYCCRRDRNSSIEKVRVNVLLSTLLNGPIRRELVSFQLPAGLAGCVTTPTLWLIPAILTRNTQNFGDVATYSVLLMIKSLIVLPASVISLALQPSAEKALGSNHVSTAIKVFRTASIVSIAVVASAEVVFAVLAKHVLTVFGQDFASETAALQVMMIAAVAEAAAICLYMRIQATNRMWASIAATLLPRDFAMLAIVVMFTSKHGLWAAIIAHVTGALVNLAGAYWLSVRSLPLKPL